MHKFVPILLLLVLAISTIGCQQHQKEIEGNATNAQSKDAVMVDLSMTAILRGDLNKAEKMLLKVVANTPKNYVNEYEENGIHFVKFWNQEEFVHYVLRGEETSINWTKMPIPVHTIIWHILKSRKRNMRRRSNGWMQGCRAISATLAGDLQPLYIARQ